MSKFKLFFRLILVITLGVPCSGEKILFLLPLASRSHVHVYEPLIRALGERGHDVVSLSPVNSSNMPPKVRQIQLVTVEDIFGSMIDPFEQRKGGFFSGLTNSSAWSHMTKACEKLYQNPETYKLLKEESFDLIIINIYLNYCVLGFLPHFKAPSIFVTTTAAASFISNIVGNRLPPSIVPSILLQYSDHMTFKERMFNTIFEGFSALWWNTHFVNPVVDIYRKHIPDAHNFPSPDEISKNTSMLFMNSHFTLTYPRPLLPDVVEVGGMHVRPPKPLPKELDDFLSGSGKDGFIFFSLGSIVKAKQMPESTRKVFIKVFSKLKQRVIWKWETETMPDLPKNVKLSKWLPQQDILGHPNIRLFMTHGGLLSTQESVFHGVPVLGLPVYGDQDLNIGQAVKSGYAKFVEIVDISEEKLEEAIVELINNPRYNNKVKELSKFVKDLPATPLDTAVYWTEYVLRHKGAVHLRSAARDLNFFQYYALDVVAALIGITAVVLYLVLRCCRAARRCMCRGKSQSQKKSKRE